MSRGLFDNLGLKLASLGLAFALWIVVAGEQRDERTLNVPLTIAQLPKDTTLLNVPGDFVTVQLRGPKSLISGLSPNEVDVDLDLSTLKEGENLVAVKSDQVDVPRGVEVIQVSPKWVRLVLESVTERAVRVAARVEGNPAAGHYFKRASAHPDRVRLIGPKSEVNRMDKVYTSTISIEGRSRDFGIRTSLEPLGKLVKVEGAARIQVSVEIRANPRPSSS
ncbi:CdaR family protein [Candidatus Methylomirabilis sp.]